MLLLVDAVPTKGRVTTSTGLSGTTPAMTKVNWRGGLVVKIENSCVIGKLADTVNFDGDGTSAGAPS